MEIFDHLLTRIGAYPTAAIGLMLVGVGIAVITMAVVIRVVTAKKIAKVFMKLKAIQLFPEDLAAEAQLIVYVNGIKFLHPAGESTKWLLVDSRMSEKIIELPTAKMYYIRFEINFSSEKKLAGGPVLVHGASVKNDTKKAAGSAPVTCLTIPLVDVYKLYLLEDGSRDTSVKAVIPYEIYVE